MNTNQDSTAVESDPQLLETLSPSRAADFKHCPQLFKFKAIDKIETPPTVYQARGTTAHLALQRLFDDVPRGPHARKALRPFQGRLARAQGR